MAVAIPWSAVSLAAPLDTAVVFDLLSCIRSSCRAGGATRVDAICNSGLVPGSMGFLLTADDAVARLALGVLVDIWACARRYVGVLVDSGVLRYVVFVRHIG